MFYKVLAPVYHYVFPVDDKDKFLMRFFNKGNRLLDVGCSDGRVALALASEIHDCTVTGIDLSEDLLEIAGQLDPLNRKIKFIKMDMLNVSENFEHASFDGVYCIGNTLVHLLDIVEIEKTLLGFWNVLKPDGKMIVQILNYDMIMNDKPSHLPLIENEAVKFERNYYYDHPHIRFEATLTNKIENRAPVTSDTGLLALKKAELDDLLIRIGFSDVEYYSGFNCESLDEKKLPLIVVAKK